VNFQVTVFKILVSYPGGFAVQGDLKRDMAILATSGLDWSERTEGLAGARSGSGHFPASLGRPPQRRMADYGEGQGGARLHGDQDFRATNRAGCSGWLLCSPKSPRSDLSP
jgi:hypothetical protein